MIEKYETLVKLQKETAGATFILGYSIKTNSHYVYIVQKKKRFIDKKSLDVCMDEAIRYITEERAESGENDARWTLNSLRF